MARGLQRAWMRGISSSMNWHEVMDECALEMDRVIARELRADPAKLDLAVAWIQRFLDDADYSDQNKDALADESDEGQRMRQSSPFAVLMPQDERLRILAKYEARRPRTHPAGV